MADKSYDIYNFPVGYIPVIIDNTRSTLNNEAVLFALIYALHDDEPTAGDIERMAKKFHVTCSDYGASCQTARKLMADYRAKPQPLTCIHHDLLWSLQKTYIDETDVMALALLLALRSIGKNGMANKTNISMIAARMSGEARPGKALHKKARRWMTRRKLEKLKDYLQERGLAYFPKGHSRGITFWLTPPKDSETPGEADGLI